MPLPSESILTYFSVQDILAHWNDANTIVEIATKLGVSKHYRFARQDYDYLETVKTKSNWRKINSQTKSRLRYQFVLNLKRKDLVATMNDHNIETLGHLACHYLLSPKHGRKILRQRIIELKIDVNEKLHWGVYGISKKPFHWPTPYYEKRVRKKPTQCTVCSFVAIKSKQIQLHHCSEADWGPKKKRNLNYYQTKQLVPLCANCHNLEHRKGDHLLKMCGQWHQKLPGNQKYKNPGDIFSKNCLETYRVQKAYYLKWYLTDPSQYRCQKCGLVGVKKTIY